MKSKKFTLVDAIIILFVIVGAVFVAKVMIPSKTATNSNVEFVIMASSVRNDVAASLEQIEAGSEAVLSHVQKTNVKINSVEKKPHKATNFNNVEKEYVSVMSEDNSDVYITVSADAMVSDTAIQSGDVFVRVGNSVTLTNKDIAIEGYIVEILS